MNSKQFFTHYLKPKKVRVNLKEVNYFAIEFGIGEGIEYSKKIQSFDSDSFTHLIYLIIYTIFDENGVKVYSEKDIENLKKLPRIVFQKLIDAANQATSISEEDVEEAKKL